MKHGYGWKRGLPSKRFPKMELTTYPPLPAKASVIPSGFLPPIWDQGQTSSCTGHGTTRAIMYARARQKLPFIDLSRCFPYWNARVAEGDTNDDGATVGDVVAASQRYGDCPYADLPTDPSLITSPPTTQAFADAIVHRALYATRLDANWPEALTYLLKYSIAVWKLPVVFGFTVYDSFESDQVANTGIVPMPGPNNTVIGGHCVTATAYDDTSSLVTFDNSWGASWGQAGRGQMPYSYIFDADLADDFHAIALYS